MAVYSPAHLKNLRVGDVFDRLENTSDAIVTDETLHTALESCSRARQTARAGSAALQRFLGYLEYSDLLRLYDEEMARVERLE